MDVEHTKALEQAASEGPWEVYPNRDVKGIAHIRIPLEMHPTAWTADAEFIAHARTAVPALVAAVERVQALHFQYLPAAVDFDCCAHCNQNSGGYVEWPCPTIRALETP
ncbi:hypothetical protein [Rhodococcus qingshengii]|uniref:hypothetical protein n=1 Tax=Rhodococcus qingshengii TaxID=334542 RepID=UPI00287FDA9E|nr:hypothetical protein [Rhodococcus qingshengii]